MAISLGLSGALSCVGGGVGGGGNLAAPSETPSGIGNPPPGGSPVAAATPGQQPTDLGWGNEMPGRIYVYVAKPDGTVELSPTEETGSTCNTSSGPNSPLLFPNDKPSIYGSFPFTIQLGPCVANACGQGAAICPKNESSDVYAVWNDQGLIYQSDTVHLDCNNLPPSPVILTLKATFSNTSEQYLPPSSAPPSDGASAPLPH